MNVTLWIIAGLLAILFLASGATKLAQPKEKLVTSMAAVGLILPAVVDIAPVLVPLAAVGVALLMAGAMVLHLRRREAQGIAVTLVLLALAAVVAWGRFGAESFTA